MLLYLKESEIESLINYSEVMQICEDSYRAFEEETSLQEAYVMYFWEGFDPKRDPFTDCSITQPCYSKFMKVAGVKTCHYFLSNPEKGLDVIQILVCLSDHETGIPLSIMPGNFITQLRTSGNSAVAAKYLARRGSSSIAIIGCGHQGKGHLLAMRELFDIKDIRIYDIRKEAMEKYRDEMGVRLNVDIKVSDNPKDAVQGADIV
ncbi:hypothetical protein LCGC14_1463870, partial [marine sediment metagenome]